MERQRQWGVRCMHEAQMHERNSFLTMTYRDDELPADRSLNHAHWRAFADRLRYWQGPFRYYQCGEYGDQTLRPHHHALIFGHDFFEDRKFWKKSGKHNLYRSEALDEIWSHGHVDIGEVTQQSAAYVARYAMKSIFGSDQLAEWFYGERLDQVTGEVEPYRLKPYASMSLKPGIGATWLDKYMGDVYPRDEVIANGRPTRPPKYYDSRLEVTDPAALEQIKKERRQAGNLHKSNNTPERLRVREEIAERQHKELARNAQ